jgi:hypothetical protein
VKQHFVLSRYFPPKPKSDFGEPFYENTFIPSNQYRRNRFNIGGNSPLDEYIRHMCPGPYDDWAHDRLVGIFGEANRYDGSLRGDLLVDLKFKSITEQFAKNNIELAIHMGTNGQPGDLVTRGVHAYLRQTDSLQKLMGDQKGGGELTKSWEDSFSKLASSHANLFTSSIASIPLGGNPIEALDLLDWVGQSLFADRGVPLVNKDALEGALIGNALRRHLRLPHSDKRSLQAAVTSSDKVLDQSDVEVLFINSSDTKNPTIQIRTKRYIPRKTSTPAAAHALSATPRVSAALHRARTETIASLFMTGFGAPKGLLEDPND